MASKIFLIYKRAKTSSLNLLHRSPSIDLPANVPRSPRHATLWHNDGFGLQFFEGILILTLRKNKETERGCCYFFHVTIEVCSQQKTITRTRPMTKANCFWCVCLNIHSTDQVTELDKFSSLLLPHFSAIAWGYEKLLWRITREKIINKFEASKIGAMLPNQKQKNHV